MRSDDAHIMRINLEGHDIPAVVLDDFTASAMPHMTNAIGGVRVQVSDENFLKAQEVLRVERPLSSDLREGFVCPNCGSNDIAQALHEKRSYFVSFLILFLVMLDFPLIKRRYQCNQCKHLWK